MIWDKMMEFATIFIELITGWIQIPAMPQDVISVMNQIKNYMVSGLGILSFFVDMRLLRVLMPLWLTIWGCVELMKLIKWIVRKIPIGSMS